MGFFLAIFYLTVTYLGTSTVFGALAAYHVEMITAGLILIVSIPVALQRMSNLNTSQSLAVGGLSLAAFLSVLIGEHWPGGAVQAFMEFIPNAFAYFLVVLHCHSKRKLKAVILMMLFVCLFVITHGIVDRMTRAHEITQFAGDQKDLAKTMSTPYLLAMKTDAGDWFYRLRGQNLINDPNDFSQFILSVIPLLFVFWRQGKRVWNTTCVLVPVCILLLGMFLTHSRGALVALTAMVVFALRRRLGTFLSVAGACGLFVLASVLHFTGGRDISAESGADRTALWGDGLQLFKSHPLFGIGLKQMADYAGNTAHNSIVVCAAELGLFGLFFWTLFLVPTVMDTLILSSPEKVSQEDLVAPSGSSYRGFRKKPDGWTKAEINRWGQLLALSLAGFLVAAFFLSRAFVLTFFLLGGIAETVYQIALTRGMIAHRLPMGRVLKHSAGLAVLFVPFMYVVTRLLNAVR